MRLNSEKLDFIYNLLRSSKLEGHNIEKVCDAFTYVADLRREADVQDNVTGYVSQDTAMKSNLLNMVKYHRKVCDGDCNVGLSRVRELCEAIGMTFTEEEKNLFI